MMSKIDENISKALDLDIDVQAISEIQPIEVDVQKNEIQSADIETDYQYTRENLYKAIEVGEDAMANLLELAKQSEHPRAYEVLGNLIKTYADANKDLLELQKRTQELKGINNGSPKNVTNALFVGSTRELQKFLKNKEE